MHDLGDKPFHLAHVVTLTLTYFKARCFFLVFLSYHDLEEGDAQSLKSKLRDPSSDPRTLAPQAKSLKLN